MMDDRHVLASTNLIIFMVGLPARGKSYITKKIARYLNWLQLETRIFNVGERRRQIEGYSIEKRRGHIVESDVHDEAGNILHTAAFFDPANNEAVSKRNEIALETLQEVLCWLQGRSNCVAVFDATNSTVQRRRAIMETINRQGYGDKIETLFLESCCFDQSIVERNIQLKLRGPDYIGRDPSTSLADFRDRVKMYEASYETIGEYEEENQLPYLKLIDVGRKLVAYQTHGFLTAQAMEFLVNFHLEDRQIWMTRNGQSEDDQAGRIGQHSPLTEAGHRYAQSMAKFIESRKVIWEQERLCSSPQRQVPKLRVWTSMMTQALQTARPLSSGGCTILNSPLLNDLHAGRMAGLTFEEIQTFFPQEMETRAAHPMTYRWPGPGGEAHLDVIHRLRAIILELERTRDHVLLVSHRAVIRVLWTYFEGLARDDITSVDVPPDTLYLIEPHPYGVSMKAFRYNSKTDDFDDIKMQS